jgi:hypothetical protein
MEALTAEQQLTEIREEIEAATERVRQMQASVSPDDWQRKPGSERWSAMECVEHLNATNAATLAKIREVMTGLAGKPKHHGPYHLDLFGWLLIRSLSSRSRFTKAKTAAPFVPKDRLNVEAVLQEFFRLQNELLDVIAKSNGLPLDAHKMQSVFEARIKYNLYAALKIVAVHEARHLDQADRALPEKE